jgi:hypothetical protein
MPELNHYPLCFSISYAVLKFGDAFFQGNIHYFALRSWALFQQDPMLLFRRAATRRWRRSRHACLFLYWYLYTFAYILIFLQSIKVVLSLMLNSISKDEEFARDPKLKDVEKICLAYTFFESKGSEDLQQLQKLKPYMASSQPPIS